MYAAAQGVSYEGLEPSDRLGPPVVRAGRAALGLAALHAGFSDDSRHDENRVQLLIDKETYEAEYFSCHPCLCTSTIKLKTSDVKNMLLPKVHHEPIVVEL